MTYVLLLFLAWAGLSLLWAENASAGPVSRYFQNALLFLIVYAAIRERRHVAWLLTAYLLGATVSALYGFVTAPPTAADSRVTGTIGDPNELASVLLPALIFGFVLAATLKNAPIARGLALGGSVVALVGLFLTGSRGGLIALGVALLAAVFVGGRWRPLAAIAGLLIVLGGVGWFTFFAPQTIKDHVTEVDTTGTGREDIWKIGARMWRAHPITGVGVGNFQTSSAHYLLAPGQIKRGDLILTQPKVAHNTYLQILAEMGVVGEALFLAIVAFALSCVYRAARMFAAKRDLRMELLARGTLVSLIGLLVSYFFISEMYSKQFWLLLGLCPALFAVARRSAAAVQAPQPRSTRPGSWSAAPSPTAQPPQLAEPA
jgi:O-antigen ligase